MWTISQSESGAEEAAERHLPHGTPAHAVAITVAARGTRELSDHERATFDARGHAHHRATESRAAAHQPQAFTARLAVIGRPRRWSAASREDFVRHG